ncbi:ABC transporter permease [Biformimicrobium ophioploci]|nr:FtsX-like permease family protein [Microbulbifer sp. NKW57]
MANAGMNAPELGDTSPAKSGGGTALALRLLWRDWRGGELALIAASLLLAVTIVTAIAHFTDRLQRALTAQSYSFLAAERVVSGNSPTPQEWIQHAQENQVRHARTVGFSSMISTGDNFQLAAVKAVDSSYPLVGHLEMRESPEATRVKVSSGPQPGEVWLEPRLLPLMDIAVGDTLRIGALDLKVSGLIEFEPDRSNSVFSFGARALMHVDDLPAAEVIQPGSRVGYRYLLAGEPEQLSQYMQWLKPQLTTHQRVIDLRDGQPRVARAMDRAESFLYLAGSLAVLLACVAISLSGRRYSLRHVPYVAVLKSLGAGRRKTLQLYVTQMLVLAGIATALGLLLGSLVQAQVVVLLADMFPLDPPPTQWQPLLVGLGTGIVCTAGFALPPLLRLGGTSPMQTLQRDWGNPHRGEWMAFVFGPLFMLLLVWWLSGSLAITLALFAGLLLLAVLAALFNFGVLRLLSGHIAKLGTSWRLASGSLQRRAPFNALLLAAFGTGLLAMLAMYFARTALIDEWRMQLPENAPNHFLVNIADYQLEELDTLFEQSNIETGQIYPMVRGRLTHVNDVPVKERPQQDSGAIRRELNLSWTDTLADDNKIVAGQWWDKLPANARGVSVEKELADKLALKLGDELRFSIGGIEMSAPVISHRTLQWDSMHPNFYMLFSPGSLSDFPATYITSFYLPPEQKLLVNELVTGFPSITIIELDKVIARIQETIDQVSFAIEAVLILMLIAGVLVLLAGVKASIAERLQEAALIRALGGSSKILMRSLILEFALIGLLTGLLAAGGAELTLFALAKWTFELAPTWHPELWLLGPLLGAILVGTAGTLACRSSVSEPPLRVLRDLA